VTRDEASRLRELVQAAHEFGVRSRDVAQGQCGPETWAASQRRLQFAAVALSLDDLPPEPAAGSPEALAPVWALVRVVEEACGNDAGKVLSNIDEMVRKTIATALAMERERCAKVCDERADEFAKMLSEFLAQGGLKGDAWVRTQMYCEQACTGDAHRIRTLGPAAPASQEPLHAVAAERERILALCAKHYNAAVQLRQRLGAGGEPLLIAKANAATDAVGSLSDEIRALGPAAPPSSHAEVVARIVANLRERAEEWSRAQSESGYIALVAAADAIEREESGRKP